MSLNVNGQLSRIIWTTLLLAGGCGYKAAPSPMLDQEERFSILIQRKQAEGESKQPPDNPSVLFPQGTELKPHDRESHDDDETASSTSP